MLKEIKADLNKWKNILSSWIKIFHAVKMEMLPKLIYRLNTVFIKSQLHYFWQKLISSSYSYGNTKNLEKSKQSCKITKLEDSYTLSVFPFFFFLFLPSFSSSFRPLCKHTPHTYPHTLCNCPNCP